MRKNIKLIVSTILLCVLVFMIYQFAFAANLCSMVCIEAPDYCTHDCTHMGEETYCWVYWECCCIYACLNDPDNLCENYFVP